MTTENGPGGAQPADGQAGATQQAPRLSILTQYVRDLSFENPRPLAAAQNAGNRPEIQIKVDVRAQQLDQERFEILLEINTEAKAAEEAVFVAELTYGGIFGIANIPPESLQPLLMIECPRLLFPFARRIIADVTRDGGFPPLMIDPIDFVSLYRRRVQASQTAAAQAAQPDGQPTN
ncbi:MAG: protein-export chaperone SecB [Geminicoccaceae bacterium]|nr:protein-export chaperone SecB [Geminicoccaceae bacterium]